MKRPGTLDVREKVAVCSLGCRYLWCESQVAVERDDSFGSVSCRLSSGGIQTGRGRLECRL